MRFVDHGAQGAMLLTIGWLGLTTPVVAPLFESGAPEGPQLIVAALIVVGALVCFFGLRTAGYVDLGLVGIGMIALITWVGTFLLGWAGWSLVVAAPIALGAALVALVLFYRVLHRDAG